MATNKKVHNIQQIPVQKATKRYDYSGRLCVVCGEISMGIIIRKQQLFHRYVP